MIKNYDPNFIGIHTIRVTIMAWDYVGHIAFEIGGNCKGASLLCFEPFECDSQEDIRKYVENDCDFTYDKTADTYSVTLRNEDGKEIIIEDESLKDIQDKIVAIEFSAIRKQD